ncbi:hypothetical protein BDR07DRAFT_1609171 [Suillus spraguei]|nr:hypothetical protein BDR07DRAFT_1609171 [Suillus spraguei]
MFFPQAVTIGSDIRYPDTLCFRNKDTEVDGHSPETWMVCQWFHESKGASMTKIRTVLGLREAEQRSCILLNINVSKKLLPITTLTRDEFLAVWWQLVMSHRTFWKKGMNHCDVSPSNLMGYRLGGRFIGIINDYDLSSTTRDSSRGLERIGMIPFISLHLLVPQAIADKVEHIYYHVAESLIWVLTWVCLRYENGKLLRKNRPLDDWLTVDAMGCHDKKMGFLGRLRSMRPTPSHQQNFDVAMQCLAVIYKYTGPFAFVPADDEEVFLIWLQNHVPALLLEGNPFSGQ